MTENLIIGVLALQGGVIEHRTTLLQASKQLNLPIEVRDVRYKEDLQNLDGLVIPGGESTVLHKLAVRENMFEDMKKIPAYFGTCAGMIMLAKHIEHGLPDQKTLELMNISVDRNAYGSQKDSFEDDIESELGKIHAIFIRAPKVVSYEKNVQILAHHKKEIIALEERTPQRYFLACAFHPELTTSLFHEHFLTQVRILKESKNSK